MQDRIFYSISFGFICGILLASIFTWNSYLTYFIFFLSIFLILVSRYILNNKWGIIASFFFLTFSIGMIYLSYFNIKFKYDLEDKVGVEFKYIGKIVDDIENRNLDKRFKLKTSLSDSYILVKTQSKLDVSYGDIVSVEGKLVKPTNFKTEAGKDFDYINYLKKDNILYTLEAKKLEVLESNKGNRFQTFLFNIKNSFLDKINAIILPYESTLLGGLILGERSSFSDKLREDFIKTGTIHIVALSGYNVTIVAEWFMKLLYFLPFVLSIYGGIIMIVLFVLMTGGYATSIRAGIMAILVLIAKITGRPYDVLRAILVTIILMLFYNPYLLYFDISFQLSFIATIAVIFFSPKIAKYFYFIPKNLNLREIITVTFGAYVFVLPFVLYKMGNLSLVALPTNFLVLPFIPLTMLLGFLTGALAFVSTKLALPFGYATYLLLKLELSIINFFASLPFASFNINNFPLIITLLIYLYFIYFIFGDNIKAFFNEDFT